MDDKLNKEEVWNKCLLFIKNRIQETAYQTWFDGVNVASISNEDITLLVPNKFHYEWLESKYRMLIEVPHFYPLWRPICCIYMLSKCKRQNRDFRFL